MITDGPTTIRDMITIRLKQNLKQKKPFKSATMQFEVKVIEKEIDFPKHLIQKPIRIYLHQTGGPKDGQQFA